MHAVDLISAAIGADANVYPYPEPPAPGVCCLTAETGPTLPRAALLGDSFTGVNLLRAPQSVRVGVPAWRAFTWHDMRPGKKRGFHPERMSAWWTDGRDMRLLDRQGVRAQVLAGPPADGRPWAGYATVSFKKHGALFAPVNGSTSCVWAWDDQRVDLTDRATAAATWARLRAAQDQGIARAAMETLDLPAVALRQVRLADWLAFEAWARTRYRGAVYRFLVYLLPSQEELKHG